MQTQVIPRVPLCRHGMRDDCPVEQCQFRSAQPSLLYSSVLKGSEPTSPALDGLTKTNSTFDQQRQFAPLYPTVNDSAAQMLSCNSSAGTRVGMGLVDPLDGSGLAQTADHLAFYRVWLQSQMDAQMDKVLKMSEQFSIPIPNLQSTPFTFPPLSLIPPPARDAVTTTTTKLVMPQENNRSSIITRHKVFSAPPAPRMPPALPVPGVWQPHGSPPAAPSARANPSGLFSARAPISPRPPPLDQQPKPVTQAGVVSKYPQGTSIAPKKEDLAYKTTPCRHYTMNRGWCPWGEDCGFIHDSELEWVPSLERTSGRSTPSSTTLGGSKTVLHESDTDLHRSVSSKSAHCWGYIQGICPHSETCKYLHPADIVPYIKYTPCLTWPRCGYPDQDCPLKHPQVDKLTTPRRSQPPSAPSTTTAPQVRFGGISPRAETYSDVGLRPQQHSRLAPVSPDVLNTAGGLVIPHDEAYASARLHHRPTVPSAEMFTPAPVQPVVRVRRPSGDVSQQAQDRAAQMQCGVGMGGYQGRARSVSIAVQKFNPEFSGPVLQTQAKAFARGHGRGKSLNM